VKSYTREVNTLCKISFAEFQMIMSYDVFQNNSCIEIEFNVDHDDIYREAWLGKIPDKNTNRNSYWFGLTHDGTQAYEFDSFEEFTNAKVFRGNSIKEIWNSITFIAIDACDVQERLRFYMNPESNTAL
jgi:hypothetical protein